METFHPRIQSIHQINIPAAVIKDFHFWGGNSHCAELCEVRPKDFVGTAIEDIVHSSSLAKIIAAVRKMSFDDLSFDKICSISINGSCGGQRKIEASIFPLREPVRAFLALGMPKNLN